MNRKLFGTDGIRGRANLEPVTAETALAVAKATGLEFRRGNHRHSVVIGKDTRLSGYLLEPALTAGFVAVGMDVILLGPVPTPTVGMLTRTLRADLGVMISASHNPFQDNGIKLFGPDGYKLSDATEARIEARMGTMLPEDLAPPDKLGRARRLDDALGRYIEFAKSTFPRQLRLDGLRIVVDCANGSAYKVAPAVLYELGAEVIPIGVSPNGLNINEGCGAVSSDALCAAVLEHRADLGIALDGDADRVVLACEQGNLVDGDQVMALIAEDWKRAGRLAKDTIVATVMSNLGLERHLAERGITLERTTVGDRYVVERMRAGGFNLGGEQSGHIVLSDHTTTGDGLIAALQVLAVLVREGGPASKVTRRFTALPQKITNVKLQGATPLENPKVKAIIAEVEAELGGAGRLLIRPSGTEPVIRVMVEAEELGQLEAAMSRVVAAMRSPVRPD